MTETATQGEELAKRPFDELIAELQRIVQALEAGSLPLEEAIGLYRRGLQLHAACEARLREAELTITQLGRGIEAGAESAETSA
ncbi:MAG TPA: exodeoxyribonuclease VII small subunit [Candidatus Limnocylindria bacterium]|nr:exodeoxyribonuclease VII small subunit [Candidatus Limnocylindria bacterium]